MRFRPLEKLINLYDGYVRRFQIDSTGLMLLQHDGERYLVESHCPHQSAPLDQGTVTDGVIECARHHYRFRLSDGLLLQATEGQCRGLRTYELVYEGNEVGVLLEDQGQLGR